MVQINDEVRLMTRKLPTLILFALVFVASCSDETTIYSDPKDDMSVEESDAVLENSIVYDEAGVLDIVGLDQLSGKTSKNNPDEQAGDYPLTLVAQVNPPSFQNGGENLTATHVHVVDDYAYVSYNTVEDGYAGAMDIINVSDPHNPRISSRLYLLNADINSIQYEGGFIYAVGGVDSEKSITATSNAFVVKIQASGGRFDVSAGVTFGFQEGFNSTDVIIKDGSVMVTSGKDGYLTKYNKATLQIENEAPFADLRSVATSGGNIAVLDASKGISIIDDQLNIVREISINTDFGASSKRTLSFAGENIVVAEGSKGAGIYNSSTGNLIEYIPIPIDPEGVAEGDKVTNAVAINEEALLMANGGAGLCLSEDLGNGTNLIGVIALNGSINYVASKNDYIFAASGKKGLQIIKLNRPDESLAARCADLPVYEGSSNLNVPVGTVSEYQGAKRFNRINVYGSLLLCGSWTVQNQANVHENALFEMNGTFVVGRNNKRKNVTVDKDATFRVEGDLTIFGDLILEDGATIEFIGNSSVADIYGEVKYNGDVTVTGNFTDLKNKF